MYQITVEPTTHKGKPRVNLAVRTTLQEITSRIPLTDNYGWARIINAAHDAIGAPRQSLADVDFNPDLNTNWQDEVFTNAFGTDQYISASGAAKNMPYRVSLGYTNQDGILKTDNFLKN